MSSDPYMDRIEEIMAPHPVYGRGWQGDDAEQRAFVRHTFGQEALDAFLRGGTMALNEYEYSLRDAVPPAATSTQRRGRIRSPGAY